MENSQLPAEVIIAIKDLADALSDQEADRLKANFPNMDYGRMISQVHGYQLGVIAGATEYAAKLHQAQQEIAELKTKCDRYETALKIVQQWQLPATGKFWDLLQQEPMSYGACYGSNGERDYMRNIANQALSGEGDRICPSCSKVFNADRNGCCR